MRRRGATLWQALRQQGVAGVGGVGRIACALAALLLLGGCLAPLTRPAPSPLLARGDERLVAGELTAALALYDAFLKAAPDDPAAGRVRATRALIDRVQRAEAAARRLEREAAQGDEDLARARAGLSALRGETARLKTDIQRLKLIDLQLERRAR